MWIWFSSWFIIRLFCVGLIAQWCLSVSINQFLSASICNMTLIFRLSFTVLSSIQRKVQTKFILVFFFTHPGIMKLDTVGCTSRAETLLAHRSLRLAILSAMVLQTMLYCRWECSYSSTRYHYKLNVVLSRKISLNVVSKYFRLLRIALEILPWKERKCCATGR